MSDDLTSLLQAWRQGDPKAQADLWPRLYPELKIIAHSVLRSPFRNQGMGTTSLVHEAALKLLNVDIDWADRKHFYAVAAKAMRYLSVDEARRRLADKRGADRNVALEPMDEQVVDPLQKDPGEILGVHRAMERLRKINARQEQLVELRYFAGMTVNETAEVLGISTPTVVREWKAARIWLHGELKGHSWSQGADT